MDMNQGRVAPAIATCATGAVLLAGFVGLDGTSANLGHSLPAIIASIAVFVLPGCVGTAYAAWRSQARRAGIEHRDAMLVMRDVAPLEAESVPLAAVHSLTEVQVERKMRERRAADAQRKRDSMFAS